MPEQTSSRQPHERYPNEAGGREPAEGGRDQTPESARPDRAEVDKGAEKQPERKDR
jgi:hypothetical protein